MEAVAIGVYVVVANEEDEPPERDAEGNLIPEGEADFNGAVNDLFADLFAAGEEDSDQGNLPPPPEDGDAEARPVAQAIHVDADDGAELVADAVAIAHGAVEDDEIEMEM